MNGPRNDNGNDNSKTEKVEFTPHCAGETQGAMHDTVKKQTIHDMRSKHKFGNDLVESLEKNSQHKDKETLWKHLGLAEVTITDKKNPTQLETMDHTKFVKERGKRFRVHQDNRKKAHLLMHGHCNKAMQTCLEMTVTLRVR